MTVHALGSDRYAALHRSFRWHVPRDFNIGDAICGRWARTAPNAPALVLEDANQRVELRTFAQLQRDAHRLANVLRARGVRRGDRVALVMPQRAETAIAHVAVHLLGAVATPLSVLFGPEALAYRLNDAGATFAIVDEGGIASVLKARQDVAQPLLVMAVGDAQGEGDLPWARTLAQAPDAFDAVGTRATDPAILIYTSGTTGPPKGALLAQCALIGNLSGFIASQNWFGFAGRTSSDAVLWSPADWAWTGGLMDVLLPGLYFGRPVVGSRARFSPEGALDICARHRVTHTFVFPTALKAMMKAVPRPLESYQLTLQSIMSAGEAVGDTVFNWCQDALNLTVNEMFGQTEINYVVGNCGLSTDSRGRPMPGWPARPGSMGRAYPGHRVAVIDEEGRECPAGTPGDVAVHRRDVHGDLDPIFFLGYWKREDAWRAKFTGDPSNSWCRTGDTAVMDDDGYLWYQARSDDVFKSAGYRIGPGEIENCLVRHPAVVNAAVVPKPDAERGALVKAYVVLAAGFDGNDALIHELQLHVRGRLAPYEYPKEIEFVDALPMTTTGKVQRRILRLQEESRAQK